MRTPTHRRLVCNVGLALLSASPSCTPAALVSTEPGAPTWVPSWRLLQSERATARPSAAEPLSFANAVSIIQQECDPSFLAAVRASGRFLYRGEDLPTETPAALLSPPPDLLQLSTYGSRDALAYFERLEGELRQLSQEAARPSVAHIAVPRSEAAAQWGEAVSVWPVGRPLHYVWPRSRDDFWPASADEARGGLSRCRVDEGLAEALQLGHEVLFASESGSSFVAIPDSVDDEVRRELCVLRLERRL